MLRRLFLLLSVLAALAVPALIVGAVPARAAVQTSAEHGLIMDAQTGQVLWQKDGLTPMPPASMSKLMTIELLFSRLKDGRVKLTDTFPVSQRAWGTQGSKMFVELGSSIPVESLLRGIIIQSGNDACVVVAEALGGTVEGFVGMMNKRAKDLGLAQSTFVNPDGLPDPPGQLRRLLTRAEIKVRPRRPTNGATGILRHHQTLKLARRLVLDRKLGFDEEWRAINMDELIDGDGATRGERYSLSADRLLVLAKPCFAKKYERLVAPA